MSAPICQICGTNPATYVCQSCARKICGNCFDPSRWSCSGCLAKTGPPVGQLVSSSLPSLPMLLFSIAFALIVIGMLLMTVGSLGRNGNFSGGAVILIGPIPIILGTGSDSVFLVGLAAFLTVVAVGFYLLLRRKIER